MQQVRHRIESTDLTSKLELSQHHRQRHVSVGCSR